MGKKEKKSTNGTARIFSYPYYAAARIQTHVNRVAPIRDLLMDALPNELQHHGEQNFFILLFDTTTKIFYIYSAGWKEII